MEEALEKYVAKQTKVNLTIYIYIVVFTIIFIFIGKDFVEKHNTFFMSSFGLVILYNIVELIRGHIEFESSKKYWI